MLDDTSAAVVIEIGYDFESFFQAWGESLKVVDGTWGEIESKKGCSGHALVSMLPGAAPHYLFGNWVVWSICVFLIILNNRLK